MDTKEGKYKDKVHVKPMSLEEARKYEMLPIKEFCSKYADGVTPQAVSYAINNGYVDFLWLGKERVVVMTEKTKAYTPNHHPKRDTLGADIDRV